MRLLPHNLRIVFVAVVIVAAGVHNASAQGEPDAAAIEDSDVESAPTPDSQLIEGEAPRLPLTLPAADATDDYGVAGPDVYWLIDELGNPRQFINYRYEDFRKAMQSLIQGERASAPPNYQIDDVAIEATERADVVECRIVIDVTLAGDGWTAATLNFGSLIGQSTSVVGGRTEEYVVFDPKRNAYVAYLDGKSGEERRIALNGLLTPKVEGGRRKLTIDGPVAPTTADIDVSLGNIDVRADEGVRASASSLGPSSSRIHLVGRGGAAALSWSARDAAFSQPSILEADGVASAVLETGGLHYEATLTIHRLTAPIDRVLVRLPPNATLSPPAESAEYEIVTLTPSEQTAAGEDSSRRIVEVRFFQPAAEEATVRLVADAVADDLREPSQTTIGSFEVVGALRQRGVATLKVGRNLHFFHDLVGRIEDADETTLTDRITGQVDAAFVYSSANYAIQVHTQPRVRNIRVRPQRFLKLFADHAELTAKFQYQITGGRTSDLRIALNGWTRTDDPIESGGAIDLSGLHVTRDDQLILPLNDPDAQEVEVEISFRRGAKLGANIFQFPLALFAHPLPGALELESDGDVEIQADLKSSLGVGSLGSGANGDGVGGAQTRGGADDAIAFHTFTADPKLEVLVVERERPMQVDSTVLVDLRSSTTAIDQQFEFDAAERNITTLRVDLPEIVAQIFRNGGLRASINGEPVVTDDVAVNQSASRSETAATENSTLSIRSSDAPLRGPTTLSLNYAMPRNGASSKSDANETVAIPIARLLGGRQTTTAVVMPNRSFQAALDQANQADPESWRIAEVAGDDQAAEFIEQVPSRTLPLTLTTTGPRETTVTLDRAWAQTWLAGRRRQDRFVYQIRVEGAAVEVGLPPGWKRDEVETLVDGELAELAPVAEERFEVRFPMSSGEHTHTVEFRKQSPARLRLWGRIGLKWPALSTQSATQRVYWHVVTPRNFVSTSASPDWFGEYRIGWSGPTWGRQAIMRQVDLENWAHAAAAAAPPASANQYLYSSFGAPLESQTHVARSSWIALLGSTACFALVMTAVYFRVGKHIAFWCLLLVAGGATASLRPELAVLLVQVVFGGGVLAATTMLLRRVLFGDVGDAPAYAPSTGSTAEYNAPREYFQATDSQTVKLPPAESQESVAASDSRG